MVNSKFAISSTLANSPINRTLDESDPNSILPPGTFKLCAPNADTISTIVAPRDANISGSISIRIARVSPPNTSTLATPAIAVILFDNVSSTYSCKSRRFEPLTAISITDSSSGFNFSTIGCSISDGNSDIKESSFVLTSVALSFGSTPKLNSAITKPPFSNAWDVIFFNSETSDMASSAFLTICDSISAGAAPGYTNVAVTIGKSTDGVRSMFIFGNETNPNTTQNKTNITVVTGLRTKNFNILKSP